jgi:hypothetical protein
MTTTRDNGGNWRLGVNLATLEREVGEYVEETSGRASQLPAQCGAKWPDNSLSELEAKLCNLTYGNMMEFAEGIMQQGTQKPTDTNSLAALIHRWAVRNRQQLVTPDR